MAYTASRNSFTLFALFLFHLTAHAQTETILQTFGFFPQGLSPCGTVILDPAGDLYGTTLLGGATNNGVVFERGSNGKYKVLYSFQGAPDAAQPNAGVTEDAAGNLYGTTTFGGAYNQGAIYKLTPGGVETVLYSFTGGADGAKVYGGVTLDPAGNLYGTAAEGGSLNYGTVWELSAAGQFTVLHNFAGFPVDGANPYAGVLRDAQGNLYGTTSLGGAVANLGAVFKLSPSGAVTLLHSFSKIPQTYPESGLAMDGAGNLYGAVTGAAYEVSANGQYTQFTFPRPANRTVAGIPALDSAGNLYVVSGGTPGNSNTGYLLKVNLSSSQSSVLYKFPGPPDKGFPVPGGNCPADLSAAPGVVVDALGNLYGSSEYFGLGGGLFEVAASTSAETTLYQFPAASGGSTPLQIARNSKGAVFGITAEGGQWNGGVLFVLGAGGERATRLPFAKIGGPFGEDAQGNVYVCGGPAEQQSNTLYKMTPAGQSTLLYTFTDGSNCLGVTSDAAGNVYGTTQGGPAPQGQVFRVSAAGAFTSLHVFTGGSDGGFPNSAITLNKQGSVYGTTFYGGTGGGVLFRISPNGTETVLHDFIPATGAQPSGDGVALDAEGNIYGATAGNGANSQGVLYKFSASGGYEVLYAFVGGTSGGGPATGVTLDTAGNLYGTTNEGANLSCSKIRGTAPVGCGVVFEFSAGGTYSVLHAFNGEPGDGAEPSWAPVADGQGDVYGTTYYGGPADYGVIYKITP